MASRSKSRAKSAPRTPQTDRPKGVTRSVIAPVAPVAAPPVLAPQTDKRWFLLGAACLILGAMLRFYNLNWDSGSNFHPDERNIANAVIKVRLFYPPDVPRQLDPQFFAYGGFSIYVYRFICEIIARLTGDLSYIGDPNAFPPIGADWGKINLVGRWCAAFFSTLTVVPLFYLARRIFDVKVARLAAFLFLFCVTSIQIAHYAITESMLVLFVTTVGLLSFHLLEAPDWKNYLLIGLLGGLALAAKTSALSFAMFPLTAHIIVLWRHRKERKFWPLNGRFAACLLVAGACFFQFSPYTFLTGNGQLVLTQPHPPGTPLTERILSPDLLSSMHYEGGVVAGTIPVPYTLQFDGTPAYLFQLKNLFWQLGPVALFCIVGMGALLGLAIVRRRGEWWLFCSFPLAYFAYVGSWHTKFLRYTMPLVPFLLIAGAWLLIRLMQRYGTPARALTGAMAAITLLWALSFNAIYRHEQTRVAASKWIYAHIPPGSRVYTEGWDDGLPIGLPDGNPGQYRGEALKIYDDETPDEGMAPAQIHDRFTKKAEYYADKLSQGDYITINSRRLYGTLPRLTEKYPVTGLYYHALFAGRLGYTKVGEFPSYPELFGIPINDDGSEETFQVYDHPKCMVFQNTGHLSRQQIMNALRG